VQRRTQLLLASVLALLLGALLLWRVISSTAARTVSIADGRRLTIQGLSYGTEHEIVVGNIWYRMLASITPPKWKKKLPVRIYHQTTDKPILLVYGEWELPGTNQPAPRLLVKEDGSDQTYQTFGQWIAGQGTTRLIMTWPVANFPRRAKSFQFDISEWKPSSWRTVAQFNLPNPARTKVERRRAEPFPATRTTNGMNFTFANLTEATFISNPWLAAFSKNDIATGFAGVFMVTKDGRPQSNWKVDRILLQDETGNEANSRRLTPSIHVGDYMIFGTAGPLWFSDSWNLAADFVHAFDFPSNELCTLKGIPVPSSGVVTQILADAEANGIRTIGVELQRVGRGIDFYRVHEDLVVHPLLPEIFPETSVSLAEVRDDAGRTLLFEPSHRGLDEFGFGIQLYPDSKTVDLTFAMQKRTRVEWIVGVERKSRQKRR